MEAENPFAVQSMVDIELSERVGRPIQVYLLKGVMLTGTLLAYDHVSLILGREGCRHVVMRHAISTISLGASPAARKCERGEEEQRS